MNSESLDFDAFYSVRGYGGIAFYLTEWSYDDVYNEVTDEFERHYDYQAVQAVMVGDDYVHIVDVDDLTLIDEDDFCQSCGQIGCGHG